MSPAASRDSRELADPCQERRRLPRRCVSGRWRARDRRRRPSPTAARSSPACTSRSAAASTASRAAATLRGRCHSTSMGHLSVASNCLGPRGNRSDRMGLVRRPASSRSARAKPSSLSADLELGAVPERQGDGLILRDAIFQVDPGRHAGCRLRVGSGHGTRALPQSIGHGLRIDRTLRRARGGEDPARGYQHSNCGKVRSGWTGHAERMISRGDERRMTSRRTRPWPVHAARCGARDASSGQRRRHVDADRVQAVVERVDEPAGVDTRE